MLMLNCPLCRLLLICSSILLLKENVKDKFDFRFPCDDLGVTAALLDFKTFKINNFDEHLNLIDGPLTRREFLCKMVKPLLLAADRRCFHLISCKLTLYNQDFRSLHYNF